ncbi:MAG: hypothetical protein R3256_13175, partial [Thalassovita sp.]|nr:hypothetical protein [Thalassovita sp.]
TGLAATFFGTAALAQDFKAIVVEQLKSAGFTEIRVSRTWLGRVRVIAQNDKFRRELILNPRTNEILRDVWVNLDNGVTGAGLFDPEDDDDNYRRSGGSDDDDRDDDHSGKDEEDEPDEPDDDHEDSEDDSENEEDDEVDG